MPAVPKGARLARPASTGRWRSALAARAGIDSERHRPAAKRERPELGGGTQPAARTERLATLPPARENASPPGGGHKIAFSIGDFPSRKGLVDFDRTAGRTQVELRSHCNLMARWGMGPFGSYTPPGPWAP